MLATATPIARRGGFEVLDLASMALPASTPILLDHRSSVDATVGRAENIRREGDVIVADCRISCRSGFELSVRAYRRRHC